jgi:hypothetical protein
VSPAVIMPHTDNGALLAEDAPRADLPGVLYQREMIRE